MSVATILALGDPRLYERSEPVAQHELPQLQNLFADLHDTMSDFQARWGWGRAIAAPQIGVHRRVVAMNAGTPRILINPELTEFGDQREEYWEDCMSFPDLMVRVRSATTCTLTYRDTEWRRRRVALAGDFAHLIEHEVDHLDGVLAVQRAIGDRSLALRATQPVKDLAMRGSFRPLP